MKTPEPLEPKKVYLVPKGGDQFDILWLSEDGMVRHVRRKGERLAREWADRKQADLLGGSGEEELPFGDPVLSAEGVAGNSWLELMWSAALMVAQNPKNKTLHAAARTVAQLANSARRFIPQQDVGEDEMPDEEFFPWLAENLKAHLAKQGYEKKAVEKSLAPMFKLLKGGKAAG